MILQGPASGDERAYNGLRLAENLARRQGVKVKVFILSRIREEYHRGHSNIDSVVEGLGATAKVITAAALIMISVFLGFVASDDPVVKMMGVGLATAVAVDATIVRIVLVPSTMALVGDPNWWLSRRLDRILPRLDLEAEPDAIVSPHEGVPQ